MTDSPDRVDSSGFDTVYVAERARVVRTAYLVVGSHAVAEELAQEAFVRLHDHFADVLNPGVSSEHTHSMSAKGAPCCSATSRQAARDSPTRATVSSTTPRPWSSRGLPGAGQSTDHDEHGVRHSGIGSTHCARSAGASNGCV